MLTSGVSGAEKEDLKAQKQWNRYHRVCDTHPMLVTALLHLSLTETSSSWRTMSITSFLNIYGDKYPTQHSWDVAMYSLFSRIRTTEFLISASQKRLLLTLDSTDLPTNTPTASPCFPTQTHSYSTALSELDGNIRLPTTDEISMAPFLTIPFLTLPISTTVKTMIPKDKAPKAAKSSRPCFPI